MNVYMEAEAAKKKALQKPKEKLLAAAEVVTATERMKPPKAPASPASPKPPAAPASPAPATESPSSTPTRKGSSWKGPTGHGTTHDAPAVPGHLSANRLPFCKPEPDAASSNHPLLVVN